MLRIFYSIIGQRSRKKDARGWTHIVLQCTDPIYLHISKLSLAFQKRVFYRNFSENAKEATAARSAHAGQITSPSLSLSAGDDEGGTIVLPEKKKLNE